MTWKRCTDLTFSHLVYFCELCDCVLLGKSGWKIMDFESCIHFVWFISLARSPLFSFFLSFLFFAACHAELDLSKEAEPRWQPAHQDPSTASISGGAQDEQQQAQYTHPSLS